MIYYAITEEGFISRIKAKDREEAFYLFDNITIDDDEPNVLLTQKRAERIARFILGKTKPKNTIDKKNLI